MFIRSGIISTHCPQSLPDMPMQVAIFAIDSPARPRSTWLRLVKMRCYGGWWRGSRADICAKDCASGVAGQDRNRTRGLRLIPPEVHMDGREETEWRSVRIGLSLQVGSYPTVRGLIPLKIVGRLPSLGKIADGKFTNASFCRAITQSTPQMMGNVIYLYLFIFVLSVLVDGTVGSPH